MRAGFGDVSDRERPSVLQTLQARIGGGRLGVHLADTASPHEAPIKVNDEAKALRDPSGRYQIVGEIARGGMGVVYKGRDVDLGRDVAMKVLNDKYVNVPDILERFVEEAQIGGQLQHPGIVPVYELGLQHDERPYFAMKLIKGETLGEQLAGRREVHEDRRRLLGVFEQVCQTMAYAHARRVVHRDLKPANIMIGSFGEVQVVDWGLAKVLPKGGVADERPSMPPAEAARSVIATVRSFEGSGAETLAGSKLGTPAYMPPEQANGDVDRMDQRSDVFGLGAILCEILTGAPPYLAMHGDILRQATLADLREARERIDACGADRPLLDLCLECLQPEQNARPASARQVGEAIGAYLSSVEERVRDAELRAVEARVKARSTRLFAAGAVLVLTAAGAIGLVLQDKARERSLAAQQRVAREMKEASLLIGRAEEAGVGGLGQWDLAIDALERAEGLAADDDIEPATRHEVQESLSAARDERDEVRRQHQRTSRDRRMLARLTELRIPTADHVTTETEAERLDEAYASAFVEYLDGRDLETLPVDEAVEVLSDGELAVQLAAALDYWAFERDVLAGRPDEPDPATTTRLRAIARRLDDDDPWRNRLRDLLPRVRTERAAIEQLADRVDFDTQPATGLVLLAEALWHAGAEDRAIEVYGRGQEVHADDFWMYMRQGLLLYGPLRDRTGYAPRVSRAQLAEAVQAFRTAAALEPANTDAWHRMALCLSMMGEADHALRIFTRIATAEPDSPHWLGHYARQLFVRDRREEGIEVLQRAVLLESDDPQMGWVHCLLGEQLRNDGDEDAAIENLELALDGGHPHAMSILGQLLERRGDWEGMVSAMEKALELEPEYAPHHNNLAWVLATAPDERTRDTEGAVRHARRAVELVPAAWSKSTLGVALYRAGDFEAALAELDESIELGDDETASSWLFRAMALHRLGQPGARESFEKGKALVEATAEPREEDMRYLDEAWETLGTE